MLPHSLGFRARFPPGAVPHTAKRSRDLRVGGWGSCGESPHRQPRVGAKREATRRESGSPRSSPTRRRSSDRIRFQEVDPPSPRPSRQTDEPDPGAAMPPPQSTPVRKSDSSLNDAAEPARRQSAAVEANAGRIDKVFGFRLSVRKKTPDPGDTQFLARRSLPQTRGP